MHSLLIIILVIHHSDLANHVLQTSPWLMVGHVPSDSGFLSISAKAVRALAVFSCTMCFQLASSATHCLVRLMWSRIASGAFGRGRGPSTVPNVMRCGSTTAPTEAIISRTGNECAPIVKVWLTDTSLP